MTCLKNPPVRSHPVADFYKGRQITLVIAHEVATGYDIYARALARHMGRHIPGNQHRIVVAAGTVGGDDNVGPRSFLTHRPKADVVVGCAPQRAP